MRRVNFNRETFTRYCIASLIIISALFLLIHAGCCRDRPKGGQKQPTDGRIIEGGGDWKDNPNVVSPLILREPLYDCTNVVWVSGFIQESEVTIFEGANPIGTAVGHFPSGEQFKVNINFVKGQVITAKQKFNGVTGGPSNAVTVRGVHDDYPGGVPTPNVIPPPLFKCGLATSANSFIPGSDVTVQSEPSTGGGTFGPAVTVGGGPAAAPWPQWWTGVNPPFELGARVTVSYKICDLTSPRSPPQIVQDQPALPKPKVQDNVYEGGRIVVVEDGLNGSRLRVFSGATQIGDSATPGGAPQQIWIDPAAASGASLTATQSLCDTSPPSDPVDVKPCSDLPAAVAKQPQPGDDRIELITFVPGARIIVLAAGTEEIGDGGAPVVMLTRPIKNDEELTIIQMLGKCRSRWVHVITVKCPFGTDPKACASDWPMFRHNTSRNAQQPKPSLLANPDLVRLLKVKAPWPVKPTGSVGFRASPIVYEGVVYIGNQNGRFYAFNATTGAQLWQFPLAADPALTSTFVSNASSIGIASSATIARLPKADNGKGLDVVIFGAPDRSIGAKLGSGRLFALNAQTGAVVWRSPEVAVLEGPAADQRHEQIGYSSPLVLNDRVYVGIADHGDNPIQNGKVVAVRLSDGTIDGGFSYVSTNTRGGGVWSSVAGGPDGELYITTGNAQCWNGGCQSEPRIDHSLSLLRLDSATGAIIWELKPVPFPLDEDPDWAAGAAFEPTACGPRVVSTMKDGWSYAVRPGDGTPGAAPVEWQFPPKTIPFNSGDGTDHGDTRYLRPGAAWESVFITTTGGERVSDEVTEGYTRLHGLNICAGRTGRVRWILDVPNTSPIGDPRYRVGAPSVTKGIIFVTTSEGHLVVFADQSAYYPVGFRCSNWNVSNADCAANGFQLVAQPTILANITLDGSQTLTEPALAGNRVYVATGGGNLYMLEP